MCVGPAACVVLGGMEWYNSLDIHGDTSILFLELNLTGAFRFQMLVCPVFYQLKNTVSRIHCSGLILQSEAHGKEMIEREGERDKSVVCLSLWRWTAKSRNNNHQKRQKIIFGFFFFFAFIHEILSMKLGFFDKQKRSKKCSFVSNWKLIFTMWQMNFPQVCLYKY